ncbi:MAG TPA: CRTAC1 family protein [Urbifossiella sp.]|nr:CRTAC1 family protein [Urbifossiella sp.]
MSRLPLRCLAALLCAGVLGCGGTPADTATKPDGPPWFQDITDKSGIKFTHDAGPTGSYFMPQQVGSGAAFFDANGDGRLDIYLLQNGGPNGPKNALYLQKEDHSFEDGSAGSGLDIPGYNMGVAIGDVNNDGKPDVVVTQYIGVKFFLNQGGGKFVDATKESGLHNPAWSTSAAFFDYDRDGRLDLVVVSYVDYDPTWNCFGMANRRDYCAPKTFKGRVSRLFHNECADGKLRFADVTESSGFSQVPGPGLGVVCADFDGDGWPDVFIANDGAPNRLWMNKKNGTFKEEAVQRGIALNVMGIAQAGMGIALGDVDGDGLFDIFVTHLTEETHTLWKQGPRGLFTDVTAAAGLIAPTGRGTGFGTLLADFDHDGALDLAIANGHVRFRMPSGDQSLGSFWSDYGDHNQIYRGDGLGKFTDFSRRNPDISKRLTISRCVIRGDIDGDGAPDLLFNSVASPARLYRNVAPNRGHWLEVRAVDPALKRDAYGAEIRIRVGDRTRAAWLHPAESYLGSSECVAHFGLGDATQVDGIEVLWPDGKTQQFPGAKADQRIVLNKK